MKIDPNASAHSITSTSNGGSGQASWGNTISHGGLTIRAELAARALQGFLANPKITDTIASIVRKDNLNADQTAMFYAQMAVDQADALITALNAKS